MPIPLPKCTIHEPLTPSPSRCPRAGLIQNCPTLGTLRPLYKSIAKERVVADLGTMVLVRGGDDVPRLL
jgi:hypothetical protein